MLVRRGEIWWADFGIPRGSEQGGQRPALIIQNDIGNTHSTTTIVAAITGKTKASYPFHVEVSAQESELPQDSTILLEQILTISKSRLIRRAGILSSARLRDVDRALQFSLSLSKPVQGERC
jgi:mRNA interferase MazF